jgi:hypothetical protein
MKEFHVPMAGLALSLALGALLMACAQTPAPPATQVAALDCASLASELHAAAESQRVAEQQQQDAWKAVVPFAVVARYAKGKAAAQGSEQRLAELQRQAATRGCPMP